MEGRKWLEFTGYNLAAVAMGIAAGFVVVAYAGGNLGQALSTFFLWPVNSGVSPQELIVRFVTFYLMALGIGIALKAGLWNVGAQGQFIIGMAMVFAAYVSLRALPYPLLFAIMLLVAAGGGLLWMVIPTILKVKFGANEIVVTLLLYVVAKYFGIYLFFKWSTTGFPQSPYLPPSLSFPSIIPSADINAALPFALAIASVLYLLIEKTPFGLRANTVGASIETAHYAGVGVTKVIVVVMLVAGALAGLSGAVYVMGFYPTVYPTAFDNLWGFLAIIVAVLGRKNVIGIGIAALFFSYITIGAEQMAQATQVTTSIVPTMEGIILIGVLLSSYFERRRTE